MPAGDPFDIAKTRKINKWWGIISVSAITFIVVTKT